MSRDLLSSAEEADAVAILPPVSTSHSIHGMTAGILAVVMSAIRSRYEVVEYSIAETTGTDDEKVRRLARTSFDLLPTGPTDG